jgi:hypothetical protein
METETGKNCKKTDPMPSKEHCCKNYCPDCPYGLGDETNPEIPLEFQLDPEEEKEESEYLYYED